MTDKYDYYQLHIDGQEGEPGRYVVKGYGEYPRSSVNWGMQRVVFLDAFDTEEAARAAYPQLGGSDSNLGSAALDHVEIPHTAPSWFDESIAGERWDDDY